MSKIKDIVQKLGDLSFIDVNVKCFRDIDKDLNSNIDGQVKELKEEFDSAEKMVNETASGKSKLYTNAKANMDVLLNKAAQMPSYKKKYERFKELCKDFYKEKFSIDEFKKLNENDKLFNDKYKKLMILFDNLNEYREENFILEYIAFLKGLKRNFEKTKNSVKDLTDFLALKSDLEKESNEQPKGDINEQEQEGLADLQNMIEGVGHLKIKV